MKKLTILLFSLVLASLFQGCSKNPEVPVSKDPAMLKLAGPVLISQDSTILELQDYFTDPKKIDSVFIDPSLGIFGLHRFDADGDQAGCEGFSAVYRVKSMD